MEMMALKATRRTALGTRETRKLRETEKVPGIIYGHGKEPEPVVLPLHDLLIALAHGVRTLDVELNGTTNPYLIKEVQYDYLGDTPIHLDLARVDLSERVKVKVGIELRGTPKGTHEGGLLEQMMADIEVECRVTDIPDVLHPLVADLDVGDALLVKDLPLPDGVVPTCDPEERVAMVKLLSTAAASESAEGEEESTAEPELIGRAKKDDEPADS